GATGHATREPARPTSGAARAAPVARRRQLNLLRTGLAYSASFLAHAMPAGHPERPERVSSIVSHLQSVGTWDRLAVWEPLPADDATLQLVHTPQHVAYIRDL